jgi:putative peptidoglycan lipid II flippase
MKRIIAKANQKISIGWAAALLAGSSFLSMFLGLLRERLLNANFGVASIELDAYRAAFKVPDFMFFILVSGALSVTFIPVLKERLTAGNKKSAWELSNNLLNFMAVITAVASLLLVVLADPIIRYIVAPGMPDEGIEMAVMMMRIIAFNPFLFAISSVFTSIQQAVGRFFFFALAPAVYNVGIIVGIMFFAPQLGIVGVAWGVILGSIMQLLVGAFGLIGLGYTYKPDINWRNLGFRKVLTLLPSRSLDQGLDYFLSLVEINRASKLGRGMINQWETAYVLHFVPINLIGIAISTAAFPQMTERLAQGRPDLFKKEFVTILRVIIWLALVTAVIAFFMRGYLVRLLVAEGNETIADLIGLLVTAIFFRALFHNISRAFYAQQDTKTPLYVSLVVIPVNILLAIWWARPAHMGGFGILGLALAQSTMAVVEVGILMSILMRRYQNLIDWRFVSGVSRMVVTAALTSLIAYAMVRLFPLRATDIGFFSLAPKFGLIVGVTLLAYLFLSYLLRVQEATPVVDKIRSILFKTVRIE